MLAKDPDNTEARRLFKLFRGTMKMKELANTAFKNGKYDLAIEKYTECLLQDPTNHVFNSKIRCNRAAAYLKKKNYKKAKQDCDVVIELDDSYVKAYIRRSLALIELEEFQSAVNDAEKACKVDAHFPGFLLLSLSFVLAFCMFSLLFFRSPREPSALQIGA